MLIPACFDGCQFHVQLGDIRSYFFVTQVFKDEFVWLYDRQLIIVNVHNFFGVFNYGRSIARKEMFSLAYTDHQWASLSCSDQGFGMILVDQYDHVGADNSFQSNTQGLL